VDDARPWPTLNDGPPLTPPETESGDIAPGFGNFNVKLEADDEI
jgi:hypothetical protein